MPELPVLMSGLAFPESPRWHAGRLYVSDWGAHEVLAVDADGNREVVARVQSFPMCIDFLPDGRMLIVSSTDRRLLRREADGSLVAHADLSAITAGTWNDIVVDGRGNAYVGSAGFEFPGGKFAFGFIALVTPDGSARRVGDSLAFPNGMAVTPDGATLIVAESYGKKLTAFDIAADGTLSNQRVWADLGDGVPDGICLDAAGAVWYGDVPNKRCVRVREGGEVLQAIDLDLACFACALGGADGRTLFLVVNEWRGMAKLAEFTRKGCMLTARAPAPGAGWP